MWAALWCWCFHQKWRHLFDWEWSGDLEWVKHYSCLRCYRSWTVYPRQQDGLP